MILSTFLFQVIFLWHHVSGISIPKTTFANTIEKRQFSDAVMTDALKALQAASDSGKASQFMGEPIASEQRRVIITH